MRAVLLVPFVLVVSTLNAAEPILSPRGYGEVKFGAKLSDIEKVVAERMAAPADQDEVACRYVYFGIYPEARFMVEQGVVTRADVTSKAKNELNIVVGARLEKVKAEHPSVVIERHQYDPDGHYLIFRSADKKSAIVMEESDGKVTAVRGGMEPSVEYVEGCQ